jgi:LmbE family N-acetylglucosaminyl deacetylase
MISHSGILSRTPHASHSCTLRFVVNHTILFSYAHLDDESFCGSGLAMKCRAAGGKAVLVTATLGQRGKVGDPPVCRLEDLEACRERELRAAAAIIGFDALHILGYRARELSDVPPQEIRRALVELIRRHRPAVVVSFDPNGFNVHPDHVAISRFTMDAVAAAGDPRWNPDSGPAHSVSRVLWTPPIPPWDAARSKDLAREPGADFVLDVSRWREPRAAALRAHRTQHLSIDRYFFSREDVDRILDMEVYRQGWGPPIENRPAADVFRDLGSRASLLPPGK